MSSFRGELWNVKASVLGLRNTKTRDRRNLEVKDITHSIIKCRLTEYESADWSVSVFVVECPVEGFSLTMRWMNDSAVTIKNIHALRLMIPKASIKETTRTLTFNCFISTIRMHNIYVLHVLEQIQEYSRTHQPRMWKSPSDPELFQGVVSTGKCCRWPQVI